jgi:hypothetical protein
MERRQPPLRTCAPLRFLGQLSLAVLYPGAPGCIMVYCVASCWSSWRTVLKRVIGEPQARPRLIARRNGDNTGHDGDGFAQNVVPSELDRCVYHVAVGGALIALSATERDKKRILPRLSDYELLPIKLGIPVRSKWRWELDVQPKPRDGGLFQRNAAQETDAIVRVIATFKSHLELYVERSFADRSSGECECASMQTGLPESDGDGFRLD